MFEIRKFDKQDWSRICEIHDHARVDELSGSVDPGAFKKMEDAWEEDGLFDGSLFVGEKNGSIVGFIAWHENEITWLYIDPAFYRRGFGKKLLQFALENTSGFIRLEVLHMNLPAIEFYKDAGFRIIEKREGKLSGDSVYPATGYIMELSRDVINLKS